MNILMYHQKHLSDNINDTARAVNEKYFQATIRNIKLMSSLFPKSTIFFINDQCDQLSKGISDNVILIDLNKMNYPSLKIVRTARNTSLQTHPILPDFQPTNRHLSFLKNYFHFDENVPVELVASFFERWFYIEKVLVSYGIKNFIALDSDCILLKDISSHNYKKVGISHPTNAEDCWPNSLICSTVNLNKFLDFVCSFYEGLQRRLTEAKQESAALKYINSFFDKPRTAVCDMALWYLFKKQNPDLFVNNLAIDPDNGVHDWGLTYDTTTFMSQPAQKRTPQGTLKTLNIKQIFYTEDGPCFEKKDTKELIKIKSLHFSNFSGHLDMIPFIDEYEKIYNSLRICNE